MKRELDEEKRKRTEAEERNKCLLEVRWVLGDKYSQTVVVFIVCRVAVNGHLIDVLL